MPDAQTGESVWEDGHGIKWKLAIDCDPSRVLESVELRATCSEAVIGLAGMTALAPKAIP